MLSFTLGSHLLYSIEGTVRTSPGEKKEHLVFIPLSPVHWPWFDGGSVPLLIARTPKIMPLPSSSSISPSSYPYKPRDVDGFPLFLVPVYFAISYLFSYSWLHCRNVCLVGLYSI